MNSLRGWKSARGAAIAIAALTLPIIPTLVARASSAAPTAGQATPLKPYTETLPGSVVKLEMVAAPAGSITLGPEKGAGRAASVTVEIKPFWIAKIETPWEAFDVFTSSGPPSLAYDQTKFTPDAIARPSKSYIPPDMGWGHHGFPVIHESFLNATMFCRWLSAKTGKKYRLPTEAEWEYAARAGATAPVRYAPALLPKYAWFAGNSEDQTHAAGKKAPNGWGLFDTLGNAGEWATDLNGKPVLCGGSYDTPAAALSTATRAYPTPAWQETDPQVPKSRWWLSDAHFAGFRVACEP